MPGLGDRLRPRSATGGGRGRGRSRVGATLARLVSLLVTIVVAIIVLGIVLVLLKANPDNAIVDAIRDAARYLSQPFDAIFELDRRRTEIAVNWGIAALVYLILGRLLSRVLVR